jgi:hypothetical protein
MTDERLKEIESDAANCLLGSDEWGEMVDELVAEVRRLRRLQSAAADVLNELEDRYDGAPDSPELWMGEHIERLAALVPASVRGH